MEEKSWYSKKTDAILIALVMVGSFGAMGFDGGCK
jgi:hypothetical protein